MFPAHGLYTHIANNNLRSLVLLAGFLGLLEILYFAQLLSQLALGLSISRSFGDTISLSRAWNHLSRAGEMFGITWRDPVVWGVIWFIIAYMRHARTIRAETGAVAVERRDEKRLYNTVETLAITAGLPMPRIEIMETPALNAYADGLGPRDASVAVTRGLLDTLSDAELEAVVAHELAHIKNRDVRMMLAATISVGILYRLCRTMMRPICLMFLLVIGMSLILTLNILFMAVAGILIASSAFLMRFGISRAREFIADATAVELTKKPGALISALRKIAVNDRMEAASVTTQAMMISNNLGGWFATHPTLEDRVAALQKYAGTLLIGEDPALLSAPLPAPRTGELARFGQAQAGRRLAVATQASTPQ
jgi:heat shock protein HtpX